MNQQKNTNYPTLKIDTALKLKDMAVALEYGSVKADRRLQIKMPGEVVDEIDRLFTKVDRSKLLTQLAITAILQKYRFADRPELGELQAESQTDLDTMWDYLEKRDDSKI